MKDTYSYCVWVSVLTNTLTFLINRTKENIITLKDIQLAAEASKSVYRDWFKKGNTIPDSNLKIVADFYELIEDDDDEGIKAAVAEDSETNTTLVVYRGTKG